ncbi:MAG: DUF1501 domain-containing protein, partial [Planctomycetota bacterium]|nr:DUF1501 domain-containing protein [Planctomycetota bacterium]
AGTIYGASDRTGGLPIESPVTPGDVIATVYRLLGVDSTYQLYDALGRPHEVVPKGRILTEIIAGPAWRDRNFGPIQSGGPSSSIG